MLFIHTVICFNALIYLGYYIILAMNFKLIFILN